MLYGDDSKIQVQHLLLIASHFRPYRRNIIGILLKADMLSQLLADGYDGEELQYMSSFIVNGGYSIIKQWINKEKPEPPETIASLLAGTIFKLFPMPVK